MDIKWKSNTTVNNLNEAILAAKKGDDGGHDATMNLKPMDRDFHAWIKFSFIITHLFNRDNPGLHCLDMVSGRTGMNMPHIPVSYTHLTLPTICSV